MARTRAVSRIERTALAAGIERMLAFFAGHAFTPHSHDTYAVGVTTAGVQAFNYRGRSHGSLPGQVFVLHPDERHDGRAGDGRAFGYRIAYVDPALVLRATEVKSLPFVREPLVGNGALRRAILALVAERDRPADTLADTCRLTEFAEALADAGGITRRGAGGVDRRGVARARDVLLDRWDERVSVGDLESIAGLDRWQLARHFRRAYGVSPHRFHTLRRLDRARLLLAAGQPLADVALRCGFADQAHFTRQFRSAYGLAPGQWRALSAAA